MQSSIDRIWFCAVAFNIEKNLGLGILVDRVNSTEIEFSFNRSPSIINLCFI